MREWIEAATAFGLAAAGIYLFVNVPHYVSGWSLMLPGTTDVSLSPTFFPQVALVVLAMTAGLVGGLAVRRAVARGRAGIIAPAPRQILHGLGMLAWMALIGGYLVLMWAAGFYLASVALMLALGLAARFPHRALLLAVAILFPAFVELLFSDILRMTMPAGRILDFSIGSIVRLI